MISYLDVYAVGVFIFLNTKFGNIMDQLVNVITFSMKFENGN